MAAFLTDEQVALVTGTIRYLDSGPNRPLDAKAIEVLTLIYPEGSRMVVQQGLRDKPLYTLILICASHLEDANLDIATWVMDYIHESVDNIADEKMVHELSKVAAAFGYSQIGFKEAMRDAPYSTLLRALLVLNENA